MELDLLRFTPPKLYLQLVRAVLMFFRYFYSSISAASEGGANVFQVFL